MITSAPAGSLVVVSVAVPVPSTVTAPMAMVPFLKITVPVGVFGPNETT